MIELETRLIQEWRDQNGRFTLSRPNYESEETRKFDEQNNDRVAKQSEQEIFKAKNGATQIDGRTAQEVNIIV